MRNDLNDIDPLRPLGEKVLPPIPLAPENKKTPTPGVFERPDGKLETRVTPPTAWAGVCAVRDGTVRVRRRLRILDDIAQDA